MRRLVPEPAEVTIEGQLDSYRPWEEEREGRPFVAMNFAATADGAATIGGVSGPIGSDADTAMLVALRGRFDAVMIGAGTMRAERYSGLSKRLVVVESGPDGEPADLPALLASLRAEGVRALLCEGGPTLHSSLQAAGLVDELFLTVSPKLVGGGPRILAAPLPAPRPLRLAWLLERDGELFARYRVLG